MRHVVLDTETTGLSPEHGHRIIEIGCLEMVNRKITGNRFHAYINPQRLIDPGAENVHGITADFLADKPVFSEIATDFLEFIRGADLIIHNAPFDVGFINHEFKLLKKSFLPVTEYCTVTDTLLLARNKHPGMHNNLDALCKRYKVDNTHRDFHGALLDARLLAQVYLLMTGGQRQLFEVSEENVNQARTENARISIKKTADLRVILANEEEQKAHQDFLEKMKKNGACAWLE